MALERAVAAGYAFTSAEAPIMTDLVEGLRSMLPRQPLAPDHEPLEERTKAIERARRQLDKPHEGGTTPGPYSFLVALC